MGIFYRILLCCLCVFFFAGCTSDGTLKNPFAGGSEAVPEQQYYFGEFTDIPIPNDMSESRDETFITFAPSGVKCGTQRFSGRLELVSLMNSMRRQMAAHGWTLRSVLRAKESTLVFEKSERIATFQFVDGLIYTDMRLFVSPRLSGDSSSVGINAYAPAEKAGASRNKLTQ